MEYSELAARLAQLPPVTPDDIDQARSGCLAAADDFKDAERMRVSSSDNVKSPRLSVNGLLEVNASIPQLDMVTCCRYCPLSVLSLSFLSSLIPLGSKL